MLPTLPTTCVPTPNLIGVHKMELDRATHIVNKMAKERYKPVGEVLAEFLKYQKNGECTHFWPDENTACMVLINKRVSK